MQQVTQQFIRLAIEKKALGFGEFTLKSGRLSPYFFNAGKFSDGDSLHHLGRLYAKKIKESGIEFDILYGPAYKGIPLASTIAVAFYALYQKNIAVCFNRKEIKDHGEGGQLIGADLDGKVLIVDDVVSAGTSVRESVDIIQKAGAQTVGIAVALDRQEKGQADLSAIQELEDEFGLLGISLANLDGLLDFFTDDEILYKRINQYRLRYGVTRS